MSIDVVAIISVAFFSSFGHCYFMCGGFNVAFLHANGNNFYLSILYHIFRILSYLFLGFLFFYFASIFKIDYKAQNIILFLIGNFMIFLGFALIVRGKILQIIENNILFDKIIKKYMKKIISLKGYKSAILLGFLNGFVPCGIVYFFLANAMSQDSLAKALAVMLVFGISTLPAMLLFASFCDILSKFLKQVFNYLSYIIIIFYGIYLSFSSFLNIK